jgi:ADP-ribosyl-[dinitrogen reductase] hydrolase
MSNGSLMRRTPLAVWAAEIDDIEIHRRVIAADTTLTHSSPVVNDANFIYSQAIAHLIKNSDDSNKFIDAFDKAYGLASTFATSVEKSKNTEHSAKLWLEIAREQFEAFRAGAKDIDVIRDLQIRISQGFVRHAFILSFYFLLRASLGDLDYAKAIGETVRHGGDSDTNACIVGGMMGAAFGVENIPKDMCKKVLNLDCTKAKRKRPAWLSTRKLMERIAILIEKRPRGSDVVIHEL